MSRKRICDVCGMPTGVNRVKVKQWHCFFTRFKTEVKDVCLLCWQRLEKMVEEGRDDEMREIERALTWWYLCDSCALKGRDRGMHECWCRNKVVQKKAINGTQRPLEVCVHWKG